MYVFRMPLSLIALCAFSALLAGCNVEKISGSIGSNESSSNDNLASEIVITESPATAVEDWPSEISLEARTSDNKVDTSFNESIQVNFTGGATGSTTVSFVNGVAQVTITPSSTSTISITISAPSLNLEMPANLNVPVNNKGSADPDFTASITDLSGDKATFVDAEVLSDGSMIVAGHVGVSNNTRNWVVIKTDSAGALDATFGTNGVTEISFDVNTDGTDDDAQLYDLEMQTDGKILLAGRGKREGVSNSSITFARLDTDGTLDTTFDSDGKAMYDLRVSEDVASTIKYLASGRIAFAGWGEEFVGHMNKDTLVGVLNSDGSLWTGFNTVGYRFVDASGATFDDQANDMVLCSTGKMYAAGGVDPDNDGDYDYFSVVSVDASDGSMYTSFDTDGIKTLDPHSGGGGRAEALSIDINLATDDMYIGGYSGGTSMSAVKFSWTGVIDTSWGNGDPVADGFFNDGTIGTYRFFSLQRLSDGSLIGVGKEEIVKLTSGGVLDTSFDTDGAVDLPSVNESMHFGRIHVESDDSFVIPGESNFITPTIQWNPESAVVIRYNSDGSLKTSYNSVGYKTFVDLGKTENTLAGIAITNSNNIISVGNTNTSYPDIGMTVHTSNGSLNSGFDSNGIENRNIGSRFDNAVAVGVQSDGKIVVASSDSYVSRYNTDGSLDTSFGTSGIFDNTANHEISDMVVLADNSIVVAGSESGDVGISKLSASGSIDGTFGTGGTTVVDFSGTEEVFAMVAQADGKFMVVGRQTANYMLVRFNSNGSVDTSFDTDGAIISNQDSNGNPITGPKPFDVIEDGSNKIVIAGESNAAADDVFVMRFMDTGGGVWGIDSGFGTNGVFTYDDGGENDNAQAIAELDDGNYIVGGRITDAGNEDAIVLKVQSSDGSLDSSFGSSGVQKIDLGGNSEAIIDIAVDSDGKAYLAGTTDANGTYDYFLRRILP